MVGCGWAFWLWFEHPQLARPTRHPQLSAITLREPENSFIKSDYYPFVQRLFDRDLHSLRRDVVVISFNYDVYLEWLLRRAYRVRQSAWRDPSSGPVIPDIDTDAIMTSGFAGGVRGLRVISETERDGFCLLKPHGMIAWPLQITIGGESPVPDINFTHVIDVDKADAVALLTSRDRGMSEVPILFPWEIMAEDGTLVANDSFALRDEVTSTNSGNLRQGGRLESDPDLHSLFRAIWQRAREEVFKADKISFIGLSMHEYLNPEFQFLFSGKAGGIRLVVTDFNGPISSGVYIQDRLDPLRPPGRVARLLRQYCPRLRWNVDIPLRGEDGREIATFPIPDRIKVVGSFTEFILNEMGSTA